MDYFYKTKEHLKNYRFYKSGIKQMKYKLNKLKWDGFPTPNLIANYENERVQSGKCPSFTIGKANEINELNFKIAFQELLVDDIDNALNELNDITKRIIEMKYIGKEKYSWPSLTTYLNLEIDNLQKQGKKVEYVSETTCRRWAKEAIKHISVCIYGLEANGQILDRKAQ